MIDRHYLDAVKKLNKHPFNQMCRYHLGSLGGDADPSYLYSLQLAHWMCEERPENLPDPVNQFGADLALRLGEMLGWEPKIVQPYLIAGEPEEILEDVKAAMDAEYRSLKEEDSQLVASRLVEAAYWHLQEFLPSLRTP